MGKRFHGQSHMKGGFNIEESTLSDNANYWTMIARGIKEKLEEAGIANKRIFNSRKLTWKEKCIRLEEKLEAYKNGKTK